MPERLLISQRNAIAVVVYGGQTLLGISYFSTLNVSQSVLAWIGPLGHAVFAAVSVLAGIIALLGVWHGPRGSKQRTQERWMMIEQGGVTLWFVSSAVYLIALFLAQPPLSVLDTKIRTGTWVLAAVARWVQIRRDRTRYRSRTGR